MRPLSVNLTTTYTGAPLAVIDGLCGTVGTELQPAQLRALADTLQRIAADAEAHRGRGKKAPQPVRREYLLQPQTGQSK